MFDKFFPDEYLASTYVIPFEELYEKGYRGVIFDIDNTLVPHGAPADERAKKLFRRLNKIGFSSCLLSNNQKPRVEMFNQEIQTAYIYNAHKPSIKNYEKAMKIMGTTKERRSQQDSALPAHPVHFRVSTLGGMVNLCFVFLSNIKRYGDRRG